MNHTLQLKNNSNFHVTCNNGATGFGTHLPFNAELNAFSIRVDAFLRRMLRIGAWIDEL